MAPPVVVVTGAARGLGRAVVAQLLDRGACVVALVRTDADAAALADASGTTTALTVVVGDLADCAVPDRLVLAATSTFGRMDALVNNAGVLEPLARLADPRADADAWHTLLHTNVVAPAQLVRAALPALRASQGVVVNVSSGAAVNAYAGWGPYCAYAPRAQVCLWHVYCAHVACGPACLRQTRTGPRRRSIC
jgi:NAD(P)-dependent dehydrogenase (short-subunit alcohol dehydrogenase family)